MSDATAPIKFHGRTHNDNTDITALAPAHIILSTLNAKYIHASLGLRYLFANMGGLKTITALREFTINQRAIDIAESLLAEKPAIIAFGIYIWNVRQTTELIALIKTIAPGTTVIIGGPEVSYEYEDTAIFNDCDFLITGQADLAFKDLCTNLLDSAAESDSMAKVINATPPPPVQLASPYAFYSKNDLTNRIMYVEASRGCPFKCEFCLSALDKTATPFSITSFLDDMQHLFDRGARQFKFVDRTFNLKVSSCIAILNFFLDRMCEDLFLHFEVIPDKLPDPLKTVLRRFPPSSLQFEVGIQSFNPTVQDTISRRQDDKKTIENLGWLRQNTNAYIHADLIFGLPGETLESFAKGFNQLIDLDPQEIQVGILKRLRGTKISRHSQSYQMRYAPDAPYQLLSNRDIDFATLQRLQRFARYWDLIGNSSRFNNSLPTILADDAFGRFWQLSEWIFAKRGQTHRISMLNLFELVHDGSIALNLGDATDLRHLLQLDYLACGERRVPHWLSTSGHQDKKSAKTNHNTRQTRRTEDQPVRAVIKE